MDSWQQRQAELLAIDDRAGFWLRTLHARPHDEHQAAVQPNPPSVRDMSPAEYAELRASLGIDRAGLDRGQVQQLGYRGDSPLVPPVPGADYVRAAAAQLAMNGYGPQARQDYGRRQQQAAQLTRSDRSR
jgi:hypothetical protein